MPIVALAIICLILRYGQLCPSQHSRIQGELITIWTVLFVSLMIGAETSIHPWLLVLGGVGGVYGILLSIWQGKLPNKRAIPDKAIYASLVPLSLYGLSVLASQHSVLVLLPVLLTGAVLANLLLVKARHRLEAFNKLLPFSGIISAVISLIITSVLIYLNTDVLQNYQQLAQVVQSNLLWSLGFLLLGLLLWILPQISTNPQSHTLLGVATFLILISQVLNYEIVVLLLIN